MRHVLVTARAISALAGIVVLGALSQGTGEPSLYADDNPALLYLHGGLREYFLAPHYPTGLEDLFTLVW